MKNLIKKIMITGISCTVLAVPAHAMSSKKRISKANKKSLSPLSCKASKAPLFKKSSRVSLSILTDMDNYLSRRFQSGLAVLAIQNNKDKTEVIPVMMEKRGNSRGDYCQYKPLRFKMLAPSINQKIISNIGVLKKSYDVKSYLKSYMSALKDQQISYDNENSQNNFFNKLGDDIKFVTHCGKSGWEMIGAGEDYQFGPDDKMEREVFTKNRHIGESLLYKAVGTLKTSTMKTRDVIVNYLDTNSDSVETNYGFFREARAKVAKRCNVDKDPTNYDEKGGVNPYEFAGHFIHKLATTTDYSMRGHNIKHIYKNYKDNTHHKAYIPYDFDLSAIVVPEYHKNHGRSLESHAQGLYGYVTDYSKESTEQLQVAYLMVAKAYKSKGEIKRLVNESQISSLKMRTRFNNWYNLMFNSKDYSITKLYNELSHRIKIEFPTNVEMIEAAYQEAQQAMIEKAQAKKIERIQKARNAFANIENELQNHYQKLIEDAKRVEAEQIWEAHAKKQENLKKALQNVAEIENIAEDINKQILANKGKLEREQIVRDFAKKMEQMKKIKEAAKNNLY